MTATVLEEVAEDIRLLDGLVRAAERANISGGLLAAIQTQASRLRDQLRRVQAALEGDEPPPGGEERARLAQIRGDLETGERILESIVAIACGNPARKKGETP